MAPGEASPGSGVFPTAPFVIRHVNVTHWIDHADAYSYAVVGHSGPNGDHVSPFLVGAGSIGISYSGDAAPVFAEGDYLDVHASCGGRKHRVAVQIWYTVH